MYSLVSNASYNIGVDLGKHIRATTASPINTFELTSELFPHAKLVSQHKMWSYDFRTSNE